jgi:hypothetical protein
LTATWAAPISARTIALGAPSCQLSASFPDNIRIMEIDPC